MNYTDIDDDMNLDDAMFLDRMGNLQVQIDEKIQAVIDTMAQELFDANQDNMLMARIQVLDMPEDKSKKHVKVDDKLHGYLITRIDMTSDFPQVFVAFEKAPLTAEDQRIEPKKNGFIDFMRSKASVRQ